MIFELQQLAVVRINKCILSSCQIYNKFKLKYLNDDVFNLSFKLCKQFTETLEIFQQAYGEDV